MLNNLLRVLLPLVLACTCGLPLAHAAIYKWIDASGTVNISNLVPPDGARVLSVSQDSPPRTESAVEAARQAEVKALSDRVRQLEFEAEFARRSVPPAATYQAPPMPTYQAAPAMQYSEYPPDYAQAANPGCDGWTNCGSWWSPYGFPATIFVVQSPNFRRTHPIHGGQRPIPRPIRPSGVAYRR